MKGRNALAILIAVVVSLGVVPAGPGSGSYPVMAAEPNDKIDPYVLEQLASDGVANIFVKLDSDADLGSAEGIRDRVRRLNFVHKALVEHAARTQQEAIGFLTERGSRFVAFWINNSIYVFAADLALVETLAQRDDVAYIRGDHQVPLHKPAEANMEADSVLAIEWNVAKINADDVWNMGYTGEGIVVANIDTGVRYTHEALVEHYRGNNGDGTFSHDYNWFDPMMDLSEPSDQASHGSHTMGTMVGGDGLGPFSQDVGVAPGAQWIASKGCGILFCSDFRLISSAQWIACPTKVDGTEPDCSKAPHVVNNSWGGGGGDNWYESYVRSWLMAGIFPVFSIGNSGPACSTAGSPGDYNLVAGVGATDVNDVLADFSSKGPGTFRRLKPDFVAPGEAVRSSVATGDSAYDVFSGTSMAAPHISGTFALLLSANPDAGLIDLYNALRTTAVTSLGAPPGPDACGGRNFDSYPNAIYGWGRVDAAAAVQAIMP